MKSNYWCDDTTFKEYQTHILQRYEENSTLPEELRIPKIIHFIWLGSNLPSHCDAIIEHCKDLHPNWEIKLWTEESIDEISIFTNQVGYEASTNYGM